MVRVLLRKTWPYLRVLLSVAILIGTLYRLDWKPVLQSHQNMQPTWLLLAVLITCISNTLAGARWSWILNPSAGTPIRQHHVGLYFAGGLINQGISTTVAGDAYRVLKTSIPGERWNAVLAVMLDRTLGLFGNNLLGAIGLLGAGTLMASWAPRYGLALMLVTMAIIAAAGTILWTSSGLAWVNAMFMRLKLPPSGAVLQRVLGFPGVLFQAPLALAIHALNFSALLCCLFAWGVQPPIPILMIWMSILSVLLILPISASGWGLREATLAATLAHWGQDPALMVLASICYGAVTLIALLPGFFWLVRRNSTQKFEETA